MPLFNVRVYGILINEAKQILVSDEIVRGSYFTKFPGGGLEFGEGTRDCLKREFVEEANLKIEVGEHFYTTDFFQRSAFHPEHQILSIYYFVQPLEPLQVKLTSSPFDFDDEQLKRYKLEQEVETFRLINWNDLTPETVTLPIDKIVVQQLKDTFNP